MDSRRMSLRAFCQELNTSTARNTYQVHAGLWLDKYIASQERTETESRSAHIQAISDIQEPAVYKTFYRRWSTLLKTQYHADAHEATALGRMIVGLGNESVLETSLTLHRTYGVPYIPGSALKGVAASYVRQYLGDESTWQAGGEAHTVLFGRTEEAGYITFFDAFYVPGTGHKNKNLYPDVITVHHQNYYQSTSDVAPTDWDNPIPVPLLSATGKYLIALAAPDLDQEQAPKWIDLTFTILAGALRDLGVGAKTSSGYGRLSIDDVTYIPPVTRTKAAPAKASPPSVPPVDEVARKIEGYMRELKALPDNPLINGQLGTHYKRWQEIKDHPCSKDFALAIVEKIRLSGCEKNCRSKLWYQEILAFVDDELSS